MATTCGCASDAETHVVRGTLTDMERELKAEGFVRIHRSRLVNWQRVRDSSRTATTIPS